MSTNFTYAKVAAKGSFVDNNTKQKSLNITPDMDTGIIHQMSQSSSAKSVSSSSNDNQLKDLNCSDDLSKQSEDPANILPSGSLYVIKCLSNSVSNLLNITTKKDKKPLTPAPIPEKSAWNNSLSSGANKTNFTKSDFSSVSKIDEQKWPTPSKSVQSIGFQSGNKITHLNYVKPATSKWVPINAKVVLQSSRNTNQKLNRKRKSKNSKKREKEKEKEVNNTDTNTLANNSNHISSTSQKKINNVPKLKSDNNFKNANQKINLNQSQQTKKNDSSNSESSKTNAETNGKNKKSQNLVEIENHSNDFVSTTKDDDHYLNSEINTETMPENKNHDIGTDKLENYNDAVKVNDSGENNKVSNNFIYYNNQSNVHFQVPNYSNNRKINGNNTQKNFRRFNNYTNILNNKNESHNYNNNYGKSNFQILKRFNNQNQHLNIQNDFFYPQPFFHDKSFQNFNNQIISQNSQYRTNGRNQRSQNGYFENSFPLNFSHQYIEPHDMASQIPPPFVVTAISSSSLRQFPVPIPPPISPKQDPLQALTQQIDYYFSLENLVKDVFLRKYMDLEGWLPLSLILNFKRVKIILNGIHDLVDNDNTKEIDDLILESVKKCKNLLIKFNDNHNSKTSKLDSVYLKVEKDYEKWLFPVVS